MATKRVYLIPNSFQDSRILEELERKYSLSQVAETSDRMIYYDTFDWRLYNKDLVLYRIPEKLYLGSRSSMDLLESCLCQEDPLFADDLPAGSLRDKLGPITEIRALSRIFELRRTRKTYSVLNPDRKIILRLFWDVLTFGVEDQFVKTLTLDPVRGYSADLNAFLLILRQSGIGLEEVRVFELVAEILELEPGKYSSKINLEFDRNLPTGKVLNRILEKLRQIITANLSGIKKDIDTEFLHDFRVSIRRTRAALSQIKRVFPEEEINSFRRRFSTIAKSCNRLRDLDVYLLNRQKYKDLVPEILKAGVGLFFKDLEQERKREINRFRDFLGSEMFILTMAEWEKFLEQFPAGKGESAGIPVIRTANHLIKKRYLKVMKSGSTINDESEDQKLHKLRIECKKLRYLLEFFRSLYPARDMKKLIKNLKIFQDNLGEFNDLSIQQEELKNYLAGRKSRTVKYARISPSLGGLISVLSQRQAQVRKEFHHYFEDFSRSAVRDLFKRLFSTE